jgi:hypothetical protein
MADIISTIGTIIDVADLVSDTLGGGGGTSGSGSSSSGDARKGPVRGARLEYDIPALGGRILMKEPFGKWFGLTPVYPEYGLFKGGPNAGKKFTMRAGFRFKSYQILLKPGTKIKVPKDKAQESRSGKNSGTEDRQMGIIQIGVSSSVAVNEFIEFLKASSKASSIIGCISPTLRKYQWGGVLHSAR